MKPKKSIPQKEPVVKQTTIPAVLDTGAGAALRALELRELEERNDVNAAKVTLQKAIHNRDSRPAALDGTDFDREISRAEMLVSAAKDQHLATSKALLAFDKSVAENKRDSGEKVTRAEMERIFSLLGNSSPQCVL